MKNGAALAMVVLILLVLGCSCQKLAELSNKTSGTNGGTSSTPVSTSASPSPSSSGKYSLTLTQYNQIKDGMTLAEAERILGGPGTEMSSTSAAGMTYTTRKWEGEGFSSVILSFKDNRVYSRIQVGLK